MLFRSTGARTNNDVIERLIEDLVNCSKHDKNKDGIKGVGTANKKLVTITSEERVKERVKKEYMGEIKKHPHIGNKIEAHNGHIRMAER